MSTENNLGIVGYYTVERPFEGKLNGLPVYTTIGVDVAIEGILHADENGFQIELRPEAPWDKFWEPEDRSFQDAREREAAEYYAPSQSWWAGLSYQGKVNAASTYRLNSNVETLSREAVHAAYRVALQTAEKRYGR